jgi:DNA-binding MarR family transcriptional regulator
VSPNKDELIRSILSLFEKFVLKIKQESHRPYAGLEGLADGHIFVLMMLYNKSVNKASDVSCELGITSGAVTGLTDKLVGMGLIRRERSEEDRRVVLLSLTDKGKEAIEQVRRVRQERLGKLFDRMDEDDLRTMERVFSKFVAKLGNTDES